MRATRIILAVFAFCAGYLISTFIIMVALRIPKVIVDNSNLVSAGVAVVFSFLVWQGAAHIQAQLLTRMFQGGFIGGVLAFGLTFIGALVLYPDCNICPVMSMFAAPIGFVIGLFGGWLVWKIRSATIIH
ncbi:hypothetical protein [Flavisolibacter tropicus]|uniref:Uncharacterized protein n=1 Tax=Flavisolibacter tropicus TaxID=1492898 RepID=A0A172TY91_9BACT|nr:hypothetical protein [Flavisolibacter tropicus]ANE51707.1 hypothetical protein SY85_15560 [Flavisolibacter tropicus]